MRRLNNSIFQGDPPKLDMSQFWNKPADYPFEEEEQPSPPANRTQLAIDRGYLPEREEGLSNQEYMDALAENPKEKKPFDFFNFGLGMRRASAGASWLSGIKERNRQNQYLQNQLSTLGQLDALPAEQPNPYNLYAKYGGKLSKFGGGGGKEDPKKKQQEPPKREPIIVNDKNDPRLKAYSDSLKTFNSYEAVGNYVKNLPYVSGNSTQKERELFNKINSQYPSGNTQPYRTDEMEPIDKEVYHKDGKNRFIVAKAKKPVQPVIYQQQPKSNIKSNELIGYSTNEELYKLRANPNMEEVFADKGQGKSLGFRKKVVPIPKQPEEKKLKKPIPINNRKSLMNFSTDGRPTPDAPPEFQVAQYDNTKPTKYSFTYPTGKYNEQKTVYFPDAGSWKQFIGNQKLINSEEGEGYGTATGYMQMGGFPFNGNIRKMKNVTINNYGAPQQNLQSSMDNLTSMIGTQNPDFMSMLQGMRSMKYGGLQHVNYFGPPFSNGAEMKMGDEDKMDVKATHSVMSKLLRGFKKGGLTPNKAREILHDGTAQGHPLTDKQRRFFGAKSKGHTNFRGRK